MRYHRINFEEQEHPVKLDKKDKKILMLLGENSRTPLTKIAKEVSLSRDAVHYRITRLEKEGVILKFFPSLNFAKLGYYFFHVFLLLDELHEKDQQRFIKQLSEHSHVVSVLQYHDRWDLEVVIIAHDLLAFDAILQEVTADFSHIVMEKSKTEIIKKYRMQYVPPLLTQKKLGFERTPPKKQPMVDVDDLDLRLLRLLSENCRESTYVLAQKLNVSPDTITYRMKKLVKQGVIRNFTTMVNFSRLKYQWYTFSLELRIFNPEKEARFEAFLKKYPQIIRSAKTLGGWDLLLYIIVEHPREYHAIIKDLKKTFSDVIKSYDAWIAYKEHSYESMPLAINTCKHRNLER